MQKNTVLIIAGVADFFFGSNSTKSIKNKESLLEGVQNIVDKNNYKSIINLTTAHETFNSVNPLTSVRPRSIIKFTLQ